MNGVDRLNKRVAQAFYGRFLELRPAQDAAIAPLLEGRNIVLTAGTGSGKTEAVLAPMVSRLWDDGFAGNGPGILYVAPTKALINDLQKRVDLPLQSLGLRVGIRHGDRDDLVSGPTPHVLLTTPESLDVLLFRHDPHLQAIRCVVVDEAHLIYNTQRGLQLSILLQRLNRSLPAPFQWAALSATIASLSDVASFLFGREVDTVFVQDTASREIDARILFIAAETDFTDLIGRLTDGRPAKLLVFADSRRECERLAGAVQSLPGLQNGVFAHYSSLSHQVRIDTERRFAEARTAVCVATSTLELGIDIGDIDAVILWGVPGGVESLLQRIGRGNRRNPKTNVVCLVPDTSDNRVLDAMCFLALIDCARVGRLPIRSPFDLFGAIGQQCLSFIGSNHGQFTRVADLHQMVEHTGYCDRDSLDAILAELSRQGYLQPHGFKNRYGADQGLHDLVDYRMIYGNFGANSQEVELRHGSKTLGCIPAINLLRLRRGDVVLFAGARWSVSRTSPDFVSLEPTHSGRTPTDLLYLGTKATRDTFVLDHAWRLIHEETDYLGILSTPLRELVTPFVRAIQAMCQYNTIPVMRTSTGYRYLTFAGTAVNEAVGQIMQRTILGCDDVSLHVMSEIEWGSLPTDPAEYETALRMLAQPEDRSIYQMALPVDLQFREFFQGWLRDETIRCVLRRLASSSPVFIPPSGWGHLPITD